MIKKSQESFSKISKKNWKLFCFYEHMTQFQKLFHSQLKLISVENSKKICENLFQKKIEKKLKNIFSYDVIMQFQKLFHSQLQLILKNLVRLLKSDNKWEIGSQKAPKNVKIENRWPSPKCKWTWSIYKKSM